MSLPPPIAVYESACAALSAIRSHPMRSGLTTFGIVIGVASVILIVAILEGLAGIIARQLDDMAPDMVIVRAETPPHEAMLGLRRRIAYEDFLAVKARVRDVEEISVRLHPLALGPGVRHGRRQVLTQVVGTDARYQNVVRVYTERGRFLTDSDDAHRRRVAVLGATVVRELGIAEDPLGQHVEIGGDWFRVVGVSERRGLLFGYDQDNHVYVPYSTLRALTGVRADENVDIYFRPRADASLERIQSQIRELLRRRQSIGEDEADPFLFQSAERIQENFADIVRGVSLAISAVVGISLVVGGIGIMNIMLVSVTERTRDIGIDKALGATAGHILMQFMVEAVLLALLGGIIGVAIGAALVSLLAAFVPMLVGATVAPWAVVLALGFTSVIGTVFGLAPAIRASRLHPIEALRHE